MTLEVLVAAMHKDGRELVRQMNLSTDAILVNQCDAYGYEEWEDNGKTIRFLSCRERGVGLSRNTSLLRAKGDIVLFSDEDIHLDDAYESTIVKAFEEIPDADVLTFNLDVDERRATFHNDKKKRIRFYNFGRYPTYCVAARREALVKHNVTFSLLFGGGAKYSCGEDSLFLHDCLKSGLHIYAHTAKIGQEVYRESTWFHGFDEKFFYDRGYLFAHLYGKMAGLWLARFVLTKKKQYGKDVTAKQARKWMKQGLKDGRKRR